MYFHSQLIILVNCRPLCVTPALVDMHLVDFQQPYVILQKKSVTTLKVSNTRGPILLKLANRMTPDKH